MRVETLTDRMEITSMQQPLYSWNLNLISRPTNRPVRPVDIGHTYISAVLGKSHKIKNVTLLNVKMMQLNYIRELSKYKHVSPLYTTNCLLPINTGNCNCNTSLCVKSVRCSTLCTCASQFQFCVVRMCYIGTFTLGSHCDGTNILSNNLPKYKWQKMPEFRMWYCTNDPYRNNRFNAKTTRKKHKLFQRHSVCYHKKDKLGCKNGISDQIFLNFLLV